LKVNFGGFVPLSTVDWRGRAVCTVFFRGCPVRCYYCHNRSILDGEDYRDVEEILALIRSSRTLISGVIFSGGEATMQKQPLLHMAGACREMGLDVGIQTNGVFPQVLQALIDAQVIDRVALDIKTRWEKYDNLLKKKYAEEVKRSLAICRKAYDEGALREFEVVLTLFPGSEDDVPYVAKEAEGVDLVLQQGVYGSVRPFTLDEIIPLAAKLGRSVKIRTREEGEVLYDNNHVVIADSIVLTDVVKPRKQV